MNQPRFTFRTGRWTSALPMLFFVFWAVGICIAGTPDTKGLIFGAILGLTITMFFVKGRWAPYCEAIFEGMADKIGVIAIVCWFWAGIFAQVLRVGGLVNGLVWLGHATGVGGGLLVGLTFLTAALFATAVGTGYGTIVAFCTLMYPAGVKLGANPTFLFAAILSGAAFGDNLAPVSDTTIVSATTQGTTVPIVVRSRFKYAIIAGTLALILFIIFGGAGGSAVKPAGAVSSAAQAALSPDGLLLLIPFALVIILAMSGRHIVVSITWGIVSALIIIRAFDLAAWSDLIYFDRQKRLVGGALIDGFVGYLEMAILILMILAAGYIMRVGGAMEKIKHIVLKIVKKSVTGAELAIWGFVAFLNVFITINTAAEIAAAPFVSEIGKIFKIHPARRANFLDAVSSALGYIFPWSGGVLIGYATIVELAGEMPGIPIVSPTEVWPYVFHGWLLVSVMFIAALTGFGRRYEDRMP